MLPLSPPWKSTFSKARQEGPETGRQQRSLQEGSHQGQMNRGGHFLQNQGLLSPP
jgi:hypothetical protein